MSEEKDAIKKDTSDFGNKVFADIQNYLSTTVSDDLEDFRFTSVVLEMLAALALVLNITNHKKDTWENFCTIAWDVVKKTVDGEKSPLDIAKSRFNDETEIPPKDLLN